MKKGFLTVLVILAVALIGCGGGADTTVSSGSAGETSKDSGESSKASSEQVAESTGLPTRSVKNMKPDEGGLVGSEPKPRVPKGPPPDSLVVKDLIEGDGPVAESGDVVTIQYVGVDYKTGEIYDSSWGWGSPYVFKIGKKEVVEGLEQGVEGMAAGDRRELVIPPALANPDGSRGGIPEKETVVYVVDLLAVE